MRTPAGEPLERNRFWHFYPKKVRTIEHFNVFNNLRQNNRQNIRGTFVQTNNDAGVMFENFLGGFEVERFAIHQNKTYHVGMTVFVAAEV